MENIKEDKNVNQIATQEHQPMVKSSAGLKMETIEDMLAFAEYVAKSPFCPRGMEKPGDIVVCLQSGAEIGLPPMMALQSIAVINGRPGIFGDAALALVRASGLLESFKEELIGKSGEDSRGYRVTLKRVGMDEATEEFTVADAKLAKLWGKRGKQGQDTPWITSPKRMLKFRARGFALRDNFGDVLKGLRTIEELNDYPEEPINVTPGKLIESVTDEKMPEKTEAIVDESEEVEKANKESGARINLTLIRQRCERDNISYADVEKWAAEEGRNIDINTEEGCNKILLCWDGVKESLQVKA